MTGRTDNVPSLLSNHDLARRWGRCASSEGDTAVIVGWQHFAMDGCGPTDGLDLRKCPPFANGQTGHVM